MKLKSSFYRLALRTLCCAMLCLTAHNANADFCMVDGLYYYINKSATAEVLHHSSYSSLSEAIIPSSFTYDGVEYTVTTIGDAAFSMCTGLSTISIPPTIQKIGNSAFYCCNGISGNLEIPESVTSIGNKAFYNCTGLTGDLIIPNSVTDIQYMAFYGCTGFQGRLQLSSNLSTITAQCFSGCKNLSGNLVIPEGITSIAKEAFKDCAGMNGTLTLPTNLTTIGESAFEDCSGFTGDLIIPNKITALQNSTFKNCSGFNGHLVLSDNLTTIDNYAFNGCSGFSGTLTIPSKVTTIGISAFMECSGFKGSLVIPNRVTTLSFNAFAKCSGFDGELTLPSSLTSIESYAFWLCSGLSGTLTFPETIKTIGVRAFSGCSSFDALVLPNSVTTINESAFNDCSGLTSLSIPASVNTISSYAFSGCSGLRSITCAVETPISINSNVFNYVDKTACSLFVPWESVPLYKAAAVWKEFFKIGGRGDIAVLDNTFSTDAIQLTTAHLVTEIPVRLDNQNDIAGVRLSLNVSDRLSSEGQVVAASRAAGFEFAAVPGEGKVIITGAAEAAMADGAGELLRVLVTPERSGLYEMILGDLQVTLLDGTTIDYDPITFQLAALPIEGDLNDDGVVDDKDLPGSGNYALMGYGESAPRVTSHSESVLPIELLTNRDDITAFAFTITFPDGLELLDDDGWWLVEETARTKKFTIDTEELDAGTYAITGKGKTAMTAGPGTIANLTVLAGARGEYKVSLTDITLTSSSGEKIDIDDITLTVVADRKPGDMNDNGVIDLGDATYIYDLILGRVAD